MAGSPALGTGGTYPLVITADNGVGAPVVQSFTLTVNETASFTSALAASFEIGQPGSFTVSTLGFPVPDITQTGALPPGVTFTDNANGTATIAGTPGNGTDGGYPLQITASNGIGTAPIQNFILSVVCPTMMLIPSGGALPDGSVGETYVQPFSVFGVSDVTFSISAGSLPGGLIQTSLGTLAGTPTSAGTYSFTVTATSDTGCSVSAAYTIDITN